MLGQFVVIMLAIGLWPLILASALTVVFLWSVALQLFRFNRYAFANTSTAKWLWLLLILAILGAGTGLWWMWQAPFCDWPRSLEAKPIATNGLLLLSWSTAAWVITTELIGQRASRREEALLDENLDSYLKPGWS